jgi:26S proteasome regulatory subunit T2
LLIEEEFIQNQERLRRKELDATAQHESEKLEDIRGVPMQIGTLDEMIDDSHAIVQTDVGSDHYVSVLSIVDKELLYPGCSVLTHNK